MSEVQANLHYAESHEWVSVEDGVATVGISDHAQSALGDLVYVELPEVGTELNVGDELGVVESVKAASDLYAPVSGEVVAVNEALEDAPENVNNSPYGDGWLCRIKMSNPAEVDNLLDADGYAAQQDEH